MANSISFKPSDCKEIAASVLAARKAKKWTLHQAAAASGISVSQFSNIELGHARPSLAAYISLCRVLGFGAPPMLSK